MLDPAQLAALAAVHRRGSFELAASELHVTPSAISQRLKALEERMGILLIRRGQPCRTTAAGLRLIRHFDEVNLMEAELARDLPQIAPAHLSLRIALNADSLASWVLPALAQVEGFLFDLVIDDQDHSLDWLRRGEVLAAITAHAKPLPSCEMFPLGALRYYASCSPAFHQKHFAQGVDANSLSHAPALCFNDKDQLQNRWGQKVTGRQIAFPNHHMASSQAFVDAAKLGLGWGMNPSVLIAQDLAAGRLVEVIPDTPLDVMLYWQYTRLAAPALAPLTKALRAAAALALVQT